MLEINLLPVREARRKADLRQFTLQLVGFLVATVLGIGLWHSSISEDIERGHARVRQMQNDIDQFKPQLEQVAAFKKRKAELEKKIDVIDGLDKARSGPVRVLNELATRTPDRLWLTDMKTKGKTISMQGKSLDNELVALFLRSLGESKYFENVDLDSTKLGDENGLKLVTFKIQAQLVSPKGQAKTNAKKKKKAKAKRA